MNLSVEALQKRFRQLDAEIRKIEAKSGPMREARDKLARKHEKLMATKNEAIQKAEKGLYDMKQEIAMISRALPGRNVGEAQNE